MSAQVSGTRQPSLIEQGDLLSCNDALDAAIKAEKVADPKVNAQIRPANERRTPPDRGIIPLAAKERIGPKIWSLYAKVDQPCILKDDRFIDPSMNDFYRDQNGWAFLLLPYAAEDHPNRAEIADAAYRRAVALGITERPEVFFACLYHFQLPEYRCIAIHKDAPNDVIEEDKCVVMAEYEAARWADQLGNASITIDPQKKIRPVVIEHVAEPSNNLIFALNTLYIHHGYAKDQLSALLD